LAYGNYIAVVDWTDVVKLRDDARETLHPFKVIVVSHLLALWVTEQPLGGYLAQILDGGQELSPFFRHPFRHPKAHPANEVTSLESSLRAAWDELSPEAKTTHGFQRDIIEVLALLETAVKTQSGVISVLEPPADAERANRVACPFARPDELPVPWNNLSVLFGDTC
jgi:hypothetical protein